MFKTIKNIVEGILTSNLLYSFVVKPAIKEGYIKIRNNYLYVNNQSPYLHSLLFWKMYERKLN